MTWTIPSVHAASSGRPEQVHIAIGGIESAGMTISWVTATAGESRVKYGQHNASLDLESRATQPASQYKFCHYTSGYNHHVLLPSLEPNAQYFCTSQLMMAAGNHEIETSCQMTTFDAYQARYRMPFHESGATRGNLFYSFDVASVHVVVLTPYIPTYRASIQFKWAARDLERVDRRVTPWIVVMMHGPWYSSNRAHQSNVEPQHAMRKDMEELLFDHRVHVVLAGHVHSYERTFPVFRHERTVNAPIYVTIGDGGNREGLADKYIEPRPVWSAYRKARYGYGLLQVHNRTHARFEWHEDKDKTSNVHDSVWLHARTIVEHTRH
ncbi:hypothetical protein DYB30_000472 [Aphanomyces astaci]|uniref:Uncharacterized protein n=1 Tax=Aphanomyces astaci TaxID=112090 RepID=A0A397C4T0_APHAT|nr:hypothetical protein DYB30_000472 [Aphanomyces astaci]